MVARFSIDYRYSAGQQGSVARFWRWPKVPGVIRIGHRSVQSQLKTKNVPAILHMPNYSLIDILGKYLKQEKQKHSSKKSFQED